MLNRYVSLVPGDWIGQTAANSATEFSTLPLNGWVVFLETSARFRIDPKLAAELTAIGGEEDYFPLGEVPLEWLQNRILGVATAEGEYADICSSEWIARLRKSLAAHLSRFGVEDIDAAVLQKTAPETLTQFVSRIVFYAVLWDSLPVEVWARRRELGSI